MSNDISIACSSWLLQIMIYFQEIKNILLKETQIGHDPHIAFSFFDSTR